MFQKRENPFFLLDVSMETVVSVSLKVLEKSPTLSLINETEWKRMVALKKYLHCFNSKKSFQQNLFSLLGTLCTEAIEEYPSLSEKQKNIITELAVFLEKMEQHLSGIMPINIIKPEMSKESKEYIRSLYTFNLIVTLPLTMAVLIGIGLLAAKVLAPAVVMPILISVFAFSGLILAFLVFSISTGINEKLKYKNIEEPETLLETIRNLGDALVKNYGTETIRSVFPQKMHFDLNGNEEIKLSASM